MPYSLPIFDSELELYFLEVRHSSVLDIGAGEGKYGEMLRRVQPKAQLIAVELDADYVEEYKLRDLYDEVWGRDAADLMNDLERTYDAVIVGDCIEHMRKSVGLDLLSRTRTWVTGAKRISRSGPNTTSEGWTTFSPSGTLSASPWSGAT